MEINKQLFEDVLSGKLKGTFVLRNGETYFSDELIRNYSKLKFTHPYIVGFRSYTSKGLFAMHDIGTFDIVNFTPYTDMKENELTIEIPNDKVIDWNESKKQNKIVFKDKQLTYKDVCEKLFNGETYYTNTNGKICSSNITQYVTDPNNATTEHQLECILAKNKLANTAKYLNGEWKSWHDKSITSIVVLTETETGVSPCEVINGSCSSYCGSIWFKSKDLARQAIEILGEETVKLALELLGF